MAFDAKESDDGSSDACDDSLSRRIVEVEGGRIKAADDVPAAAGTLNFSTAAAPETVAAADPAT